MKTALFIGSGRNGKGVVLTILIALLGALNVAALSMQQLGSVKHSKASLINKRLLAVSEGALGSKSDRIGATNFIKAVTGEDRIDITRRGAEPWRGKLQARILITANLIPAFIDSSPALGERIISLMFSRIFAEHERDYGLTDKLLGELSGIFNWAAEGYRRLKANGKFTLPASSARLTQDIVRASSGVTAFIEEACDLSAEAVITESEFYRTYTQWCAQTGTRPMGKGELIGAVIMALPGRVTHYRPWVNGRAGERSLRGVKVSQ
jgi:putative DNA primase/helicase